MGRGGGELPGLWRERRGCGGGLPEMPADGTPAQSWVTEPHPVLVPAESSQFLFVQSPSSPEPSR